MAPSFAKLASGLFAATLPLASAGVSPKDTWAVIAVGSAGYMNYRHQADGCHAYHVLVNDGVPPEQIILMMQDDVASSKENPFPGKLFNKPGNSSKDVYEGCKVDYKGNQVTAKLFIDVITGNAAAVNGPVLKTGKDNRVFLNFVDHGGAGIVAFPNGPVLHASMLKSALATMESQNMFKELVFYMEACESGSMFPGLTTNSKIYAVTASNAHESSFGTYCMPDDDFVNGQDMKTCLGDLFSVNWMEDSDAKDGSETIKQQVATVIDRTKAQGKSPGSHVQTFGDVSFVNEALGDFELRKERQSKATMPSSADDKSPSMIDVRDMVLRLTMSRYEKAEGEEEKERYFSELQAVIADRTADKALFKTFAESACSHTEGSGCAEDAMRAKHDLTDLACHAKLVNIVYEHCPARSVREPGGWNAYNMKYSQLLVNACESQAELKQTTDSLASILSSSCSAASAAWRSKMEPESQSSVIV